MIAAIIVAAGQGKRMGGAMNKVWLPLAGQPVLSYSLRVFAAVPGIEQIIVVAAATEQRLVEALLADMELPVSWTVVAGGAQRQDSVAAGLACVAPEAELVVIHDGARPLIDVATAQRALTEAAQWPAVCVGVRVKDTIKVVDGDGCITATPPRDGLWSVQTPQVFRAELLRRAYAVAAADGFVGTDDASLVERLGGAVRMIEGSYDNLKITTPEDLPLAERLLRLRGVG